MCVKVKSLSCVRLFATPWTVAHQAPPSMRFFRQEYWSGLPFPSPEDLPDPGIKPRSPALQADALTSEPPGKPVCVCMSQYFCNYRLDLLPLEHRHMSPLTRNQHKPPSKISLQGEKSKRSNITLKLGKRRPQVEQARKKKKKKMKRQRNTAQMKEQGTNSQDQINKEE